MFGYCCIVLILTGISGCMCYFEITSVSCARLCSRGLFCSEKLNSLREMSSSVVKFLKERNACFFVLSILRLFFGLSCTQQ